MRIKPISKKLPTATGAVQLIQAVVFVSLSVIGTRALNSEAMQVFGVPVLEPPAPQSMTVPITDPMTVPNEIQKVTDSQIWVVGKGEQYLIDNTGKLYFVGPDGQKLPID